MHFNVTLRRKVLVARKIHCDINMLTTFNTVTRKHGDNVNMKES